jgi:hypothetical protein
LISGGVRSAAAWQFSALHRSTPLYGFQHALAAARVVVVEAFELDDPVVQVDEAHRAGSTSGYFSYSASAMAVTSVHFMARSLISDSRLRG